jgi:UDP-N-acetylmuramate dehydrogenase
VGLSIKTGPSLAELTTLKLGGTAVAELVVTAEKQLDEVPEALERLGGRPVVLGRGSNVLAAEGDLDLTLIRFASDEKPEVIRENGETATVAAPAGMPLPRLLAWLKRRGLAGLENLAGIPGSVGGAVAMNAGSWGLEICERIVRVKMFSPCCGLRWMLREDLDFGYRRFSPSGVLGRDEYFLVTAVELETRISRENEVGAAMSEWLGKKKASQPIDAATAGCVFKNPEGGPPAGKLLDEAGFRGFRLGGMAFSELHANFMVNLGGGNSREAMELIEKAGSEVRERFGRDLSMEVKVLS